VASPGPSSSAGGRRGCRPILWGRYLLGVLARRQHLLELLFRQALHLLKVLPLQELAKLFQLLAGQRRHRCQYRQLLRHDQFQALGRTIF
jgi:hypothetical protein